MFDEKAFQHLPGPDEESRKTASMTCPAGPESHEQASQVTQAQTPSPAPEIADGLLLHQACLCDDLVAARRLLDTVADADAPDARGRTPLHVAAGAGGFDLATAEFVRLLCARGACVGARDSDGLTPLMHAVREVGYGTDSVEATAVLLAHGADARAADELGRTALHHLGAESADACLYAAAGAGSGSGATDCTLPDDVLKLRSIARQLLAAGADPEARDHAGRTLMDVVVSDCNACAALALANEGVLLCRAVPPLLAQRMAEVYRVSEEQRVEAVAAAAALQQQVARLWQHIAQMEADQLANMGPSLRALIVGAATEVRRLQQERSRSAASSGDEQPPPQGAAESVAAAGCDWPGKGT